MDISIQREFTCEVYGLIVDDCQSFDFPQIKFNISEQAISLSFLLPGVILQWSHYHRPNWQHSIDI